MQSEFETILTLTVQLFGSHPDLHICQQQQPTGWTLQVIRLGEEPKVIFEGETASDLALATKATIQKLLQLAKARLRQIQPLQATVDRILEEQKSFLTKVDRLAFPSIKRTAVLTALYNCAFPLDIHIGLEAGKKLFESKKKQLDLAEIKGKRLGIVVYDLPEQTEIYGSTSYDFFNSEGTGLCATIVERAQQMDEVFITRELINGQNNGKVWNRVDPVNE